MSLAYTIAHGNIIPPPGGFQRSIPLVHVQSFQLLLLRGSQIPAKHFGAATLERLCMGATLDRLGDASAELSPTIAHASLARSGDPSATLEPLGPRGSLEDC